MDSDKILIKSCQSNNNSDPIKVEDVKILKTSEEKKRPGRQKMNQSLNMPPLLVAQSDLLRKEI